MPKRVGNLYQTITKDYIRSIILRAASERENRPDIKKTIENLDACVNRVYSMLMDDSYVPHKPRVVTIYDVSSQKFRKIQMLPFFPDCIIQWIVVDLLMPVLMKSMDAYSCSSIPGRGGHKLYRHFRRFIRRKHRHARCAVQMDIHHYYESIDIGILMAMLRRKCKDERLLRLVEVILRSTSQDGKSLAIGFYLNQWLANFYLQSTDRLIHQGGAVRCYGRYMDNITFIGSNKRRLRAKMREICESVKRIGLSIKGDYQLFPLQETRKARISRLRRQAMRPSSRKPLLPCCRDLRAVGFRFFGTGRIALRRRNWLRLRRQMIRIMARLPAISRKTAMSFLSRYGNIKHTSAFRIRAGYIKAPEIRAVKRSLKAA